MWTIKVIEDRKTMCPKGHFLILVVLTIVTISSFFPFCLCSYPFPELDIKNYHTTKNYSSDITEKEEVLQGNYYELGLQTLVDDVMPARALAPSSSPPRVVSVDDYLGSDRRKDHTKAFKKAWKEACSTRAGVFLVPKKKYRVRPITFSGPCHSHFTIKILGTIEALENMMDYKDRRHWLVFQNIRNFQMQGGGTIDGKGNIWWQNSCKINKTKPCTHAPTAMTFYECKNFRVDGLRLMNAQQMHLSFQKCAIVRVTNLFISAPEHSPNTDGIHITQTRSIQIKRTRIQTGDDCISIVSGSKIVEATDISCGPGHGISIGSLGKGGSKAHVSTVLVRRAKFSGTTNGVRIKTWQGGRGYAKNIAFENISMRNVSNPIIIDQHYCDQKEPCPERKMAVQVKNVVYKNIKGTSATEVAIKLDCSKRHRCGGIVLENVKLKGEDHKQVKADCHNVKLYPRGKISPKCFPD